MNGHWPTSGAWVLPITIAPALTQPPHDLGVTLGRGAGPAAAEQGRVSGEVDVVLDRDRDPEQRAAVPLGDAPVGRLCLSQRLLGADHAERVQNGLGLFRPPQRVLDELTRGDLAGGHHRHLLAEPEL